MKMGQKDKMVHDDGEKMKIPAAVEVKSLVCGRDCHVPGLGHFKHGDSVTDARLVEALKGHPFFHPQEVE